MDFGERLYRLRISKSVYQKELAVYLHVSIGTISNYENGVHQPDLKTLCKIADYFQVSADYLLGRTKFSAPVNTLNQVLVGHYTTGDIMNIILKQSAESHHDLIKYLTMLKLYEELGEPSE